MNNTHTDNSPDFWDTYTDGKYATAFPMKDVAVHLDGTVLDIGCGDGTHAKMASAYAKEVYGIDYSPDVIERAKRVLPEGTFAAASAYALPYEAEQFDAAYSIDVIEHMETPEKMILEAKRVLKPGGVLITQTPNYPMKRMYDFYNTITKAAGRTSFADDPTHIAPFSANTLKTLMEKHFTVEKIYSRNIFLEGKIPAIKTWRKKGGALSLLLGQKTIIVARKK